MIRIPLDVRRRLRTALRRILPLIPATERKRFKRSVLSAVRIFTDIRRPKGVNQELKWLFESARNPQSSPVVVWGRISHHAKQIVCQYDGIIDDLPDPHHVPAADFRRALSARIDRGGRWVQEKQQRRWKSSIVGALDIAPAYPSEAKL